MQKIKNVFIKLYKLIKLKITIKFTKSLRLPWYFLVGMKLSGKKLLIKNSKSNFLLSNAVKFYLNGISDIKTYISRELMLITTNNKNDFSIQSLNFCKYFLRKRKFFGIIYILDIFKILNCKLEASISIQNDMCYILKNTAYVYDKIIPLYIVFNKCDMLTGFNEIFNQYENNLIQVDINDTKINIIDTIEIIEKRLDSVVDDLYIKLMQQKKSSKHGTNCIYKVIFLPEQLRLCKTIIKEIILSCYESIKINGIYFMSNLNSNKSKNLLIEQFKKKYDIQLKEECAQSETKLITNNLFQDNIKLHLHKNNINAKEILFINIAIVILLFILIQCIQYH